SALTESFSSEHAAHSPGIDIGFEALLVCAPYELGETALIEALVLFGEGEDDISKTQACNIIQVTLKVLGIAHPEVTHAKLHRHTFARLGAAPRRCRQFGRVGSRVLGDSTHHLGNAQLGTRTRGIQLEMGVVAL